MTNTLPSFVNRNTTGNNAVPLSPLTLPASLQAGNLLIAIVAQFNGTIANVWTVAAPWQMLASVGAGADTSQLYVAYTYVQGGGADVGPTFSTGGVSGSNFTSVLQFKNARLAAPIGNSANNKSSSNTTAITCAAIAASADHSLALAIASTTGVLTWPPSGWVDVGLANSDLGVATKALTNLGDSTGSISTTQTTAPYDIVNIELLGALPFIGTDWFNGVPVTRR